MARVFVSHSNKDRDWVRQHVVAALCTAGHEPFFGDDCIKSGDNFIRRITAELKRSDTFVVVASARAIGSDWVSTEVEIWFREHPGDDPMPVLMEPCEPYHVHPRLVYCQAVDLSDPATRRQRLQKLVTDIRPPRRVHADGQTATTDSAAALEWAVDGDEQPLAEGERTNSIGMKLVQIPAGEFLMGTVGDPGEELQHRVRITRPFYLGAYAVTQAEYEAVMGTNPTRVLQHRRRQAESARHRHASLSGRARVVGRRQRILPAIERERRPALPPAE